MKKSAILVTIFLVIVMLSASLFLLGRWYLDRTKQSVKYSGRTYNMSTLSPMTLSEVEQKFGKKISYKERVLTGEVWASDGGCDVQPCTQTVIFIKQKDGKFQDYALSGGP